MKRIILVELEINGEDAESYKDASDEIVLQDFLNYSGRNKHFSVSKNKLLKALHVMATTDIAVTWQKHSCIAQIEYEKVGDYESAQDIIEERKRRGV